MSRDCAVFLCPSGSVSSVNYVMQVNSFVQNVQRKEQLTTRMITIP